MADIITGIKVTVKGSELAALCEKRYNYHKYQMEGYQKSLDDMLKLQKDSEEKSEFGGKSGAQSPDIAIRNSIKTHEKRMKFYEWAKDHFVADETHRIDFSDLQTWEIAPDRY